MKYTMLMFLLSLLVLFTYVNAQDKKTEPKFIDVPTVVVRMPESTSYADVINHAKTPYLSSSRTTNAHESTHDINNDLSGTTKWTKDGFYLMYGRGIILDRPKLKRLEINPFVPVSLRYTRYHMYLAHTKYGGESPLYLMDEWVAYTNGAIVALEDIESGKWENDRIDTVEPCLEFSIYTISLCMAIEHHDPNFWNDNVQFKNFVIWNLKRAENLFLKGRVLKECKFQRQEDMWHNLKVSKDSQIMRDFITKHFDGVFLK